MSKLFSINVKYSIYMIPFIIVFMAKRLKTIDSNLVYTFFLAYILILFIFDLWINIKKDKKTENLVNVIEDIAKGNLRAKISIGSGTRRNLYKIEENLTQLMKNYCGNNYNKEIIKEKQVRILSKYKEIALFFITDASGLQIYNSLGGTLVNNGEREYFKNAKQSGKPQISDIVISKITDKLAIVISVPYFREKEFAGIFATTIDMQAVSTPEEKLGNALLGTVISLKGLIRYLQNSGNQVASSAQILTAISQQSAVASKSVAASSYEVTKDAKEQLSEVLSTTAAIQQVAASIQEIFGNAEQINDLSHKASKSALAGEEEVKNAMNSMVDLGKSSQRMRLALDEINKSSAKMDHIVGTIHAIADQTNLLALNASIEAARAGEAGRGFTVVAEEIRKLSEGSKKSTMEINNLIQEIQNKIDEINHVVDEDGVIVHSGTKTVNYAGSALNDIISFVNTVNEQVTAITAAINEVAQGSQNIASSTDKIQQRSKDVSDEIHNVSVAAEEQTSAMQEIASASQNLSKLSKDLQDMADSFKV